MSAQYDTSITRMLEDEATWSSLYETLKKAVSCWVYEHKVPSWVGQENDIIEDAIQETLVRTWRYLRERERGRAAPIVSLPQFTKTIAYNYCRDLRRRDSRLMPPGDSSREYILVFQMTEDPQEIAVEQAWQEEVFLFIANAVSSFPAKQRHALLTDLACHMDFQDNPTPLQRAFLQEGIQLEQYQRPPSGDAGERNRYFSALGTAYKRLKSIILAHYEANSEVNQAIKRRGELPARKVVLRDPDEVYAQISVFWSVSSSLEVENMSSQAIAQPNTAEIGRCKTFMREMTAMNKPEKEHMDSHEEQEASMILDDSELARLALHLRRTPPPIIDPAYREALQSKLLETLLAQRHRNVNDRGDEVGGEETMPETNSRQETRLSLEAEVEQERSCPPAESETGGPYDVELAALARCLQQTAPTVPIDPRFKEELQEKLLEVARRPVGAAGKRRS